MKRTFSVLLCVLLLLPCFTIGALAAEDDTEKIRISTAGELMELAANCVSDTWSQDKTILLENDINLTGLDFTPIPLLSGTFDGQGHNIIGVSFDAAGSTQGLFRMVLASGEVRNVRVSGVLKASGTGESIGGIAGVNYGRITNCRFDGDIQAVSAVGGIAGLNAEGAEISGCTVTGTLYGRHRVGGIAGENRGTLRDCRGMMDVNTEYIPDDEDRSFDISTLRAGREEDIIDITDIGGIAGLSSALIENCANSGAVGYPHVGYNVGGVVGRQSGRVVGCANHGEITGRKDVGGIVGQIEPHAEWNFTGGGLSGMRSGLYELESSMNTMLGNMGAGMSEAGWLMQDAADIVSDSIDIINGSTGGDPSGWGGLDDDAVNQLSANLEQLTEIMSEIAGVVGNETLTYDMQDVSSSMTDVSAAMTEMLYGLGNSSEALNITDVSDANDPDTAPCAVVNGMNRAEVSAETNVGGIAGNIALDVSFDREDQLNISSVVLDSGRYEVLALISGCKNYAGVSAVKSCAGGIAGRMDYGLVSLSGSAGSVSAGNEYAGGVAGLSAGTLRGCTARANVSASSYMGGIAGSGKNIENCRAMPHLEGYAEFQGSIAGFADGSVKDNLYSDCTIGGVDGFSFSGQAQYVDYEEFIALDGTPDSFRKISVSFSVEGKTIETVEVPFGGSIDKLPDVPDKDGMRWRWDDFDSSAVYFSMTVDGSYVRPVTTLASDGNEPLFLAEGVFDETDSLLAVPLTPDCAALGINAEELVSAYTVEVPGYDGELTVRMLTEESGRLYKLSGGALNELGYTRDGSRIVFTLENGGSVVLLQAQRGAALLLPIAVAVVAAAGAAAFFVVRKKKAAKNKAE